MNDLYVRLANHLDKLPISFPSMKNGVEIEILKKWFSLRQVEIALQMRASPEPVSVIAKRLNADFEDLATELEEMSRKGLIFRMAQQGTHAGKDPKWLYNLVPLAEGLWEFHMNIVDPDEIDVVNKYLEFFMKNAWFKTKTTQHRVIPIATSIDAQREVMPYDQAESLIRAQSKIAVSHCVCRKHARMLGHGCDHPTEVCLSFGTGAHYYIENGWAREISQTVAIEILHVGMSAGLVLQPGNAQKTWCLCMCCACSCQLLRTLKNMPRPAELTHSNFFAVCNDNDCTMCGVCVDRCPMDAIELGDVAVVDRDRCIGCGVCVGACDFDAMSLREKSAQDRYSPPKDIVEMQKKIARERGLA